MGSMAPLENNETVPRDHQCDLADAASSEALVVRGVISNSPEPDLLFRSSRKATTPTTASEPTTVPTAMPALAPPLRPSPEEETAGTAEAEGVAVGASKPSAVTFEAGNLDSEVREIDEHLAGEG